MIRRNKHRAPVRRKIAPWLSGLAVLLGVLMVAYAAISAVTGWDDPPPSASPSESSASAPATASSSPTGSPSAASPSPSWPVETEAPPEDVVPGEGSFVDPSEVDRTDPDAVAEAAASLYGSHDTLVDQSEADSRERVAPLLDPWLLEVPQPQNPSPGGLWLVAQEHDAYSQPLVTPLTVPALGHEHAGETAEEHAAHAEGAVIGMPTVTADGEPALGYQFDVLYHWQGRDDWVSSPETAQKREVKLTLVERDGKWIVVEAFYASPQITGVK